MRFVPSLSLCTRKPISKLSCQLAGLYDEGPTLECAECGARIESSYGDPDDKADTEESADSVVNHE